MKGDIDISDLCVCENTPTEPKPTRRAQEHREHRDGSGKQG